MIFFSTKPSLNQFLARPTYQSAIPRVNLLSINSVCWTRTHCKYSFPPPRLRHVSEYNVGVEFSTILYAYRNGAAGETGIIRGVRVAAEYFNMFVYLTSSLYRKYCTALSPSLERFSPRRANGTYLEFGARGCPPFAPGQPILPSSPRDPWQRAANGTLNASTARNVALWTCWALVTCRCDLFVPEKRSNHQYLISHTDCERRNFSYFYFLTWRRCINRKKYMYDNIKIIYSRNLLNVNLWRWNRYHFLQC